MQKLVIDKALLSDLVKDELGLGFTTVFLSGEWRQVMLPQRIGRRCPLESAQRPQATQEFEQILAGQGLWTHETVHHGATRLLEITTRNPFQHTVVDEAQHLSPHQWWRPRATVAEAPDDIGQPL